MCLGPKHDFILLRQIQGQGNLNFNWQTIRAQWLSKFHDLNWSNDLSKCAEGRLKQENSITELVLPTEMNDHVVGMNFVRYAEF